MSVFNEYRNFSFDLLKVITLIYSFSAIGHRFHQKEQTQSSAELIISFCREHELTDRQQDIVKMIVNGSTNKEISETLFITEGTVKTHIHNIFRKTGVTSRNQIIAKVLEK